MHPTDMPGSSVHGILQTRTWEWFAISSFRGSSQPEDQTCVSCISCIGRWILYQLCLLGSPKEENLIIEKGFLGGSDGKESSYNARDPGSIPESGRSPGEGNGNPLQYSWLESSRDRGVWGLQFTGSQKVGHDQVTNTHRRQRK